MHVRQIRIMGRGSQDAVNSEQAGRGVFDLYSPWHDEGRVVVKL